MNTSIEIPENLQRLAVRAATPRDRAADAVDHKLDMRTTLAKRLRDACHTSHIACRYEKRGRKYGNYRLFTSANFYHLYVRLRQEDSELEDAVIDLIAATRKITA